MTRMLQLCLTLCFIGALAACGFQLRGQYTFDFDKIGLAGLDKSEMYRTLDLQFQIIDLKVNPVEGAPLKVTLLSEQRDRSIVTFSGTGRAREVRITYEVTYKVEDRQGDFLIATTQLGQQRELTYSDDQILGKESEENQLYQDMQKDIARQIILRLSALKLDKK